MTMLQDALINIWHMALEAAPWLTLGLLAAALIRAFVPTAAITRWLGGRGVGSVLRASVVGIPLPLCSCGVLPTALGLRRQGASRASTASFLVSTPEIGIDSFLLSLALLGPTMAAARPISAFITAVAAGLATLLVTRHLNEDAPTDATSDAPAGPAGGCCATEPTEPTKKETGCCGDAPTTPTADCCDRGSSDPASGGCDEPNEKRGGSDCCSSETVQAGAVGTRPSYRARLGEGITYVFGQLWDDIKFWLIVAVVVAGLMVTFIPPGTLAEWGSGPLAMVVMLVVGVPLYVCAIASTPIAAGLLAAGVSPGVVLVLLLAGPATNLGSVAILKKEIGPASVIAYLTAISVCSIAAGLGLNAIVAGFGLEIVASGGMKEHIFPDWFAVLTIIWLTAVTIRPLRRRLFRGVATARGSASGRAPAGPSDAAGAGAGEREPEPESAGTAPAGVARGG